MKKLSLLSIVSFICLLFSMDIYSQSNPPLYTETPSDCLVKEEIIKLKERFNLRDMAKCIIILYKGPDYLRASLTNVNVDIKVQISDETHHVYYEGVIYKMQQNWRFDTSFLAKNKKYKIKLIIPNGYLYAYFDFIGW